MTEQVEATGEEISRMRNRSVARFGARWRGALCAVAVVAGGVAFAPAPAAAEGVTGSFLAGRFAANQNDPSAAAYYYARALVHAPDDIEVLGPAMFYALMTGDMDAATPSARRVAARSPRDLFARMILLTEAVREDRFEEALGLLDSPAADVVPTLIRSLSSGWALFGAGDYDGARARFRAEAPALPTSGDADASSQEARQEAWRAAYAFFGGFHLGLMESALGDDEAALAAFTGAKTAANGWGARLAMAAAGAMTRMNRREDALALYEELLADGEDRPRIAAARDALLAGARPAPLTATAADGVAEVLHGVGSNVGGRDEAAAQRTLFFMRLAAHLRPDFDDVRLVAAEQHVRLGHYGLAAALYESVPMSSPLGEGAVIGQADALARAGENDTAMAALDGLIERGSSRPSAYFAIGALQNEAGDFAACADAYETGLALLPQPDWRVLYRLGVCKEQGGYWESAEVAFSQALEIEPDQPDVLNHFGYSLVEQGRRLEEAKAMIETAVEARPESGYIVDSLGWVLYRLGDFEGAVKHLEAAVALEPAQSVINDHFGDALWQVGRRMEAQFQWRRALSFDPDGDDAARIKRKLKIGLDAVLAEEASARTGETEASDAEGGKKVEANEEAPSAPSDG